MSLSSAVAAERFAIVRAPSKRPIRFERSGHHITSEEPGQLLASLHAHARPIAAEAGDATPDR